MYVNYLHAGSVHFWAGRAGCGKTKSAISAAIDVACAGERDVIVFSLQHEKAELLNMISTSTRKELDTCEINIIDIAGISVEEIISYIEKALEHSERIFCVIDELPLVSGQKLFESRREEIQYIITELREYVSDKYVAILATLPIAAELQDNISGEDALKDYAPAEFWIERHDAIINGKLEEYITSTVSIVDFSYIRFS